jgi:D-3-phosphoglycerate dehydrogenase / 2-oxoglutarate reductase
MGVDNIDVRAATMAGVIVMNTPAANSIATAEQTLALMLALSRHTASPCLARLGEWRRNDFVGVQLYGKTLGIIGIGRIGQLVARARPVLRHGGGRLRSVCFRGSGAPAGA